MSEKKPAKPRIPEPDRELQVNFCKNPVCRNFGRPASTEKQPKGPGAQSRPERDDYLISARGKNKPRLECLSCGWQAPLKSNLGINEELERFSAYLQLAPLPACPNPVCDNHAVSLKANPKAYYTHSKTRAGSKRYRCKECLTTFSLPATNLYQKQPHVTLEVFKLLTMKVPVRKICKKTGISAGSFYAKLDYIHRQCLKFVANREWKLLEGMPLKPLRISIDRQEYMVNWTNRLDRRTTVLQAVGSSDNKSRYVFGMHLNFDPSLTQDGIEEAAQALGDLELPGPFRRHARHWLLKDYAESLSAKAPEREEAGRNRTTLHIRSRYSSALEREDVEAYEKHSAATRLPERHGVQIHSDYTLYAHFLFLRRMLRGAKHVTFYMDQESGIRAACLAAFWERILDRSCDAFYVAINKTLNSDQLDMAAKTVRKNFLDYKAARPYLEELKDLDVKYMMMVDRMPMATPEGPWKDMWVAHPYPLKNEPEMQVSHLTKQGGEDKQKLAWSYLMASLRGIDGFFQKVRRDLSLLERPTPTASSNRRIWYGYSPYNPAVVVKLLDIYRVFFNYVETGRDGKTPAMRLGLAKGTISYEDILYYRD